MGTHYRGAGKEVRALDAYIKLLRASESVVTRAHRRTACDLTVSQFGVLESLYHLGSMHQRKIGTKLLKSGGNVTMVIDNLERRGLVERRRDQKDRRFVSVHLTPAGERLIAEVFPRHVQSIVEEMSPLSGEEQETLSRLLRKLGRRND
jgi:MarR family transcriptional regulator, 2-MHQ and catechol-resistance regulon repressor